MYMSPGIIELQLNSLVQPCSMSMLVFFGKTITLPVMKFIICETQTNFHNSLLVIRLICFFMFVLNKPQPKGTILMNSIYEI